MVNIIKTSNDHLSLEYEEGDHENVKRAIEKIDKHYKAADRLDSASLEVDGSKLTAGQDEMGRFLISSSSSGDRIIKYIKSLIDSWSK